MTIEQALNLALQHHQAGRLSEAEKMYRDILAQQPNHAEAMHLTGVLAHQAGQLQDAVELIERAIASDPTVPEYHNNLGLVLTEQNKLDEAIAAIGTAINLKPQVAQFHYNLGIALARKNRLNEAVAAHRRATELKPDYALAYNNLGNALHDLDRIDEAIVAYSNALKFKPNLLDAQHNLGNALRASGQLDAAIANYRAVLQQDPTKVEAFNDLGLALQAQNRPDAAIEVYNKALTLKPDFANAHNNLGNALWTQGHLDAAAAAYRTALKFESESAVAHNNLGNALFAQGELVEAIACFHKAVELDGRDSVPHENLLYAMHFHPGYDAQAIYDEHCRWNQRHAEPLRKLIQPHTNVPDPHRKVRIGYVSPDLCEHPVGRFLLPLLENHDRSRVEVFCYSDVLNPDWVTQRLRAASGVWRNTTELSNEKLAQVIREDAIDILVDITMHMRRNRMLLFARKPAPVQVTYLAYCSTTGLKTIDYRITDPYLDPPGINDAFYSEESIRLPETYWCYLQPQPHSEVKPPPVIRGNSRGERDRITFGCLNNFFKVNAEVLKTWCQLLREVPDSRLIMHCQPGSHRGRVRQILAGEGIDPSRLMLYGTLPIDQYFALYDDIDIALDPFPYNGGTTTCDALWMGVPVVSLAGRTGVSRAGLSLLSNIGLPEFVAHSQEDYVKIAAELAGDLPRLAELRSTLRRRMQESPLMDSPRFARNVQDAFCEMWRRWCSSARSGFADGAQR